MSVVERATAKVGPLPVWAWALVLLLGGYLAYRFLAPQASTTPSGAAADSSQPSDTTTDPNLTPVGVDTGSPPASGGGGGSADNLSDDLYGQLTGVQTSVDALTAAVQMSPAFWPGGETGAAGSGSTVPNGQTPASPAQQVTKTPPKPAAKPAAIRYYTFLPGKAPKNRKADELPAKGPAGTTRHYAAGKGYYYS